MRYFASALLTILIAAMLPSAALAYTWTYTFQFKVNANNLPNGSPLSIQCVLKNAFGTFTTGGGNNDGFTNAQIAPLTSAGLASAYAGTVNVTVSHSSSSAGPDDVPKSYFCELIVHQTSDPVGGGGLNVEFPLTQALPGWTGTMWVSGNLP